MPKRRRKKKKKTSPTQRQPEARSGSPLVWGLILLIVPILAYGAYRVALRPADSSTQETATTSDHNDEQTVDSAADTPLESVQVSATRVRAPGATQQTFVAPLADAYRRIDPTADGWQTEAFNEASDKQLKLLAALFKGSVKDANPDDIADVDFACSTLRPETLREVFQDASLRVDHADPSELAGNIEFQGPVGLQSAVNHFREQYKDGSIERIKLKPFRIESDGDQASTTVYFQSVGDTDDGRLQVNATWDLAWSLGKGDEPKLTSITVEDYETVLHRGSTDPMFSDCTASVLGNTAAYKSQLLHSTDHWRARLPRDLGLDVVANHGLAIGDVNGDDLEDIYVCQQGGLPNRLFVQNSDGTLRDISEESGTDWLDYCASALLVDFDNDGDRDLVVAQEWRILLMSNDGNGRFQLEFGTSSESQSFSLAAADYDLDGDVDIYVCGYNATASTLRRGVMGEPLPYHDANNGGSNMLLRNDGNWLFTDVTNQVGLDENNSRFSFAAAWEDYDNDGDPDLYVANDYGRNSLYQNQDGKFVDVAPQLNVEDMSAGMSASWADFNRDGRMDLYVSNMFSAAGNRITYQRQFKQSADANVREQFQRHARGNSLFLNTEDGFQDVSEQAGVTMGRWAWGSRFADLNGDGWEDLIVANGFISTEDTGDL